MTDATAKYILTAEDKTKNAIASVKRGFDTITESVHKTRESVQLLTEIFLGARLISGIHRLTEAAVEAAAATNGQFKAALDSVHESTQRLLSPSDGMPAAIEAMEHLNQTLNNPDVQKGADKVMTILVTGWAKVREEIYRSLAGWALITGNGSDAGNAREQMKALQDEIQTARERKAAFGSRMADSAYAKDGGVDAFIDKTMQRILQLQNAYDQALQSASDKAEEDRNVSFKKWMADFDNAQNTLTPFADSVVHSRAEKVSKIISDRVAAAKRAADEMLAYKAANFEAWDKLARDNVDSFARLMESETHKDAEEADKRLDKAASHFGDMSEYAKEAARQIQDAFAEFLFDPFKDGLNGMVSGFIDAIRRMVAEVAASKVFDFLKEKAGSGGLLGIIGKLLTRAEGGPVSSGTSYLVGERGPEIFTPGASGMITPNYAMAGGVTINYNVDARGATTDLISALPGILRQHGDALKADLLDGIRRRRYAV